MEEHVDLRPTLQQIVASACQLTGARYGILLVSESDWNMPEFVTFGLTTEDAQALLSSAELTAETSELRQPRRLGPRPSATRTTSPAITNLLAVPIHLQSSPYGQLCLLNKEGDEFSEADEQLAATLAKAACSAVDNLRLLRQKYRRQQWLEETSEMIRGLLGEIDLATATDRAARRIREISGADYSVILLADPNDPGDLVFQAVSGLDERPRPGERIPRHGIARRVIDSGQAIVTEDLMTDPRYQPTPERREPLSGLGLTMFMPLNARDEVMGVLVVSWLRGSPQARLAVQEVDLVQAFANQTALTLQRVRAQEDQRRRERWLEAASQMAQLLLGEVDRDEAMRLVIRQLQEISGADIAGVVLADQTDPDSMYVIVFEGVGRDGLPPDVRVPRWGLVSRVLASGRRIVSDDYTHLPGYEPPPGWTAVNRLGLGMVIPLITDREPLGALCVGWNRGSPHAAAARAETEQIQTFADLAALALQRVRTQGDREHLMLLEERDRIAHEMRDLVIQRLFGVGLRLRTAGDMSSEPAVQQRIQDAIKELDTTNRQIRSTIFGISEQAPEGAAGSGP
ncbi:GAF domain-containing protein [Actinopolymorpha pittospori]